MNIDNSGVGGAEVNATKELKVKDSTLGRVKIRAQPLWKKIIRFRFKARSACKRCGLLWLGGRFFMTCILLFIKRQCFMMQLFYAVLYINWKDLLLY